MGGSGDSGSRSERLGDMQSCLAPPTFKMSNAARGSCAEEMAREENGHLSPPAVRVPRSTSVTSPDQEYDFVEEPPPDFYCAVSLELLLDPHQTVCCGHHLSSGVVVRLQRERRPCPMCQNPAFKTHADLYLRRKVRELQVRCRYRPEGCEWVSDLGNRDAHTRTCTKQPWSCPHCRFSGLREAEQSHIEECALVPVRCPNNCSAVKVARKDLSEHVENICPLQPKTCSFAHVGCKARLPRSEIDNHIQNNQVHHMMLTCSANLDLTRQLNEKIAQKEEAIDALKAEVARLGRELGEKMQVVETGVAAQSDWMESSGQKPPEIKREEEGEGEREKGKISEESVRNIVATELQGMEERVVQAFKREVTLAAHSSSDESDKLVGMVEQEMRAVEDKLEKAVCQMEQGHKVALERSSQLESVVGEMMAKQESALREGEERGKAVVREVERVVAEQVKTAFSKGFVEVEKKQSARGSEGVRGEKESEEDVEGVVVRVGKEEVRAGEREEGEETSGVAETVGLATKPAPVPSPKPKKLPHHHHHRKINPSQPPVPSSSSAMSLVSPSPPVEEDATRKTRQKSATHHVGHSLSLVPSDQPLSLDSSQNHPPCQFTIEQFTKLKDLNKEWRSPPFHSPRGYKMCLGVWPNGFRSGYGTHISVEFYKMRDANTDKLQWPVKLPIHVRIYNYRTKKWERDHVNGDTFSRSKVSGEFETSGYAQSHRLIAHEELGAYLLDDNFRIQVYKCEVKQ